MRVERMIRLTVALLIAIFVASCNLRERQEAADHAHCIELGWVSGTPGYDRCRYAQKVVVACGASIDPALCALEYMRDYDAQQRKVQSDSASEPTTESQRDWQVRKTIADAQASIVEFKNARDHNGRLLHPHFDTVRHEMGTLMQQASVEGVSLTLEQAYYIAIANVGLD
jgi:hypothetical protein